MITVLEILERARTAGQRLPYNEAAVLFAAAVRLAAANDSTLRARLIRLDDGGGLHLAPFDEEGPDPDPAYLAPELLSPDAPDKNDPKVQVYAAGVLGYELLTGKVAPPSGHSPGPELSGPLGEIVRLALAPDRRTRIEDLKELEEAVEGVQPRPPAEGERNILVALRNRFSRPSPEKEPVGKLIDRLQQLEAQVATLGRAQSRMEAAQRQSLETMERFEVGQLRAGDAGRRQQPVIAPAILAGTLSAVAVVAVAWGLGLFASPPPGRPAPPAPTSESPPPDVKEEAKPPPAETKSAANKPVERKPAPAEAKPAAAEAKPAPPDATPSPEDAKSAETQPTGQATSAQTDAAAPAEANSAQTNEDAGAVAASDSGSAPQAAPPAVPPAKKRAATPQTAMLHALAVSQVRRGEDALEQGNADDALASFRAALENEPTIAVAFRGLGMAYAMQGHDAEALQAYDKYLRLSPKAPDAPEIRKSIRELRTRAKVGTSEQ